MFLECACEKESVCVYKGKKVEQDSTKTECMSKTALRYACVCVCEYVSVLVFSVLEHCFIVLIYSWALCVICFKSQLGP